MHIHTYRKPSPEGEREVSSSCRYRWHSDGRRRGCGAERWCQSAGPVYYHLAASWKRKCREAVTWKTGNGTFVVGWNRNETWQTFPIMHNLVMYQLSTMR